MHCYGALECAFTYKQPIGVVYKHALDLGLLGREMETFEQLLQPRVEFVVAARLWCIRATIVTKSAVSRAAQRQS